MRHLSPYMLFEKKLMVGGTHVPKRTYKGLFDSPYGPEQSEVDKYLSILDTYQEQGGEIIRMVFSYDEPNTVLSRIGHSWTHNGNDWRNFYDSIYDFNRDEGKIEGDEGLWMITAVTPPGNIDIVTSLEQYQNNPEEEELHIDDTVKLKVMRVEKVK